MNSRPLPTLPSLPPRPGAPTSGTGADAFAPPAPPTLAPPTVATLAPPTMATLAPPAFAAPTTVPALMVPPVAGPSALTPPVPSIAVPPAAATGVRTPHTPIDIAALRRPKRKIRSTIVTTTVVGIFLAGLVTGVVLAWRTIDESAADETRVLTVPDTSFTPSGATTPAGAPAAPLQVAGSEWVEHIHTPLTVRVPPSATVAVNGAVTTYTSVSDLLVIAVQPYTSVGNEQQLFDDTVAGLAATLQGTSGPTSRVNSLGTAFQAAISSPDGTWTHVRALFLGGMAVIIAGQGDQAEPTAVRVAWTSISYGGVVATGA